MRIVKQIPMILIKLVLVVLVVAATAAVTLISISGPYAISPEAGSASLPSFDELIPEGTRTDSALMIKVLFGDEIVEMPLERYLIGTVAAEMPASFQPEALKAQAVAARTNVMYRIDVSPNLRHPDAQVCTDNTCCMAYSTDDALRERWGGDYVKNITRVIDAVLETDGVYMTYGGKPIFAVFHSSSAGKTEASRYVWVSDLPYLVSVDSPETPELVPGFITTVTVSKPEFKDIITNVRPDALFGEDEESWITDVKHTDSGRILELTIGGAVFKGTELRSMFNLRSTAVSIDWTDSDIVFTVTGYGHGVGMSQYGANIMAMAGNGYDTILSHYYTGIEITGT